MEPSHLHEALGYEEDWNETYFSIKDTDLNLELDTNWCLFVS